MPREEDYFTKFCRHCGYNLYGLSENRCPECGNTFDPNDPKSFLPHEPSFTRQRWIKRIIAAMLVFVVLASAAGWSLWYPWHREQAAVRMIQRVGGHWNTLRIGPQWLQKLRHWPGGFLLERVSVIVLYEKPVTDSDLATLDGLTELRFLEVVSTQVTDAGLEQLKKLNGIQTLNLDETKVTNAGLVYLKDLKRLQWLDLDRTHVTDAGLVYLKDLKTLRELDLSHTQVTDAGLMYLKDFKGLQWLHLNKTQVTDTGVAELQKALPGCQIEH